jgi:hypothetical protein
VEPNWFGLAIVLGFIAAGTLIFFLAYKLLAAVCRRLFPEKFKEIPSSQNVTPHALVATLVVLSVALVLPVYVMTSMPNFQINGFSVAVWLGFMAALAFAEKKLLALNGYKKSWWCSPIGHDPDRNTL